MPAHHEQGIVIKSITVNDLSIALGGISAASMWKWIDGFQGTHFPRLENLPGFHLKSP
jgi:hypothetical protein